MSKNEVRNVISVNIEMEMYRKLLVNHLINQETYNNIMKKYAVGRSVERGKAY